MFHNVIAIVSGGASGLGAATASYLVRHGARVIVADLPAARENFLTLKESLLATMTTTTTTTSSREDGSGCGDGGGAASSAGSSECGGGGGGGSIEFAAADVTSECEISSALDMAEEAFGDRVNVSVNCAGFAPARKTLSRKVDSDGHATHRLHPLEEFARAMTVNAIGSFNLARLAADRMARRPPDVDGLRGIVIHTASIAAYDGQAGQVAYAASKGGVIGMTLPMARDLAPLGVRVMTIAPGLFGTPLLAGLPEKVRGELAGTVPCPARLGDPIEYAKLVGCIIQNPYLNGEVIRLDGALRMPA